MATIMPNSVIIDHFGIRPQNLRDATDQWLNGEIEFDDVVPEAKKAGIILASEPRSVSCETEQGEEKFQQDTQQEYHDEPS